MRHSITLLASTLYLALSTAVAPLARAAEPRTLAVDVPAESRALVDALENSGWLRWLRERDPQTEIVVGPGARGDVEILVRPLPMTDAVRELVARLPVALEDGVLELDGTTYRDRQLTLALRLPRAGRATWLITGYPEAGLSELAGLVLAREAGGRVWGRSDEPFDYLLRESRWLERSGRWLERDGVFEIDRATERDDFSARDAYYAGLRSLKGRWTELAAPPELTRTPELQALAARLDAATGEMARRIPLTVESPIRLIVESDYVAQGRHLGEIGPAVTSEGGALHLVVHRDDEHAYLYRIAATLISRAGLATGDQPWIEDGAALWLSRRWFGRDADDWLPRLVAGRLLPTPEQLLAEEKPADGSEPLWVPVAASLIGSRPGDTLRQKLAQPPSVDAARAHLARLSRLEPPSRSTPARQPLPFLDGISFAMLNRIDGGYHAPSVDQQLERLERLGANAVSLMPFAYQPGPNAAELRFMNRSPTSETDVGTVHAARRAHAAGFHVLWKPHLWISHDSWPGDVEMQSEDDWAAWWDGYRRYVAHHALLAEWTGADLFSIGVELGRTLGREREWDQLITAVRLLYGGAVTYAGNWHGDYDQAPFWDRLDYVGVDAYFPLAHAEDATPAEITEGARAVAERLRQASERFGKPVLLTEIGYAARTGAWVDPHREGGTFATDHQALAYQALFDALGRPAWLRGIFAWKAFSDDRGNSERPDFRFLGRPAEAVIGEYFSDDEPDTSVRATAER